MISVHNASKFAVVSYRPYFFKLIIHLGIDVSLRLEKESWYGSTMAPIDRCGSPESMYCTGKCRDNPVAEEGISADIVGVLQTFVTCIIQAKLMVVRFLIQISLSSSKDSQRSWEDPQGSSMTQVSHFLWY